MQNHLEQAYHNNAFLIYLDTNSLSDLYCDWKITILFYIALHLLHAYAKFRGVTVRDDHRIFHEEIDPNGSQNKLKLSLEIFNIYFELYNASRRCRYAHYNFSMDDLKKLNQITYNTSKQYIPLLLKYLKEKGFIFDITKKPK